MIKNAPVLEIKDFGSCGYDYRVDIKGGDTFGYLNSEGQGNWIFSETATNDSVSYEDYTLSELKEELEFELANFYTL